MKVCWGFLLLAGIAAAQAPEKYEIKDYSPKDGIVKIKSGAGITTRPFSSFCSADQQKINSWLAAKTFKSDSALLVDIRQEKHSEVVDKIESGDSRKAGKKNTIEHFSKTGTQDIVAYTITLENLSTLVLNNITVEYKLFYETNDGADKAKKRDEGRMQIMELRPKCPQTHKTKALTLRDEKVVAYENSFVGRDLGSKEVHHSGVSMNKDRLKGLYVCVSTLDENGDPIQREYEIGSVPDKEKWGAYGAAGC